MGIVKEKVVSKEREISRAFDRIWASKESLEKILEKMRTEMDLEYGRAGSHEATARDRSSVAKTLDALAARISSQGGAFTDLCHGSAFALPYRIFRVYQDFDTVLTWAIGTLHGDFWKKYRDAVLEDLRAIREATKFLSNC